MSGHFPFSKKILIVMIGLLVLLTTVVFLYVQLQINNRKPLTGGYSVVFECLNVVKDKQSASSCFNDYFENKLEEQISMRGEGEVPDYILEFYEKVDESQIIFFEQGLWSILRGDFGSPFFIKDSVIMYEHG